MRKTLLISLLICLVLPASAQDFSMFESRSLLGMKAEPLTLKDAEGRSVNLYGRDRYSVLFFYDAGCPKCTVESILMRSVLENRESPLDLYAIYVGADRQKWDECVDGRFSFEAPGLCIFNLWDPDREFDFQLKYGVIGTPKMFLIRPDGTIVGRLLTSDALDKLLQQEFGTQELSYGSDDSVAFYDSVFSPFDGAPTAEDLAVVAGHIAERTLEEAHDTALFRQMGGDLLYYLSGRREEGLRNGTEDFIDKYILSRPDVWRSSDDSLKVVGLAMMMKGLLSKAPVGAKVPDIRLDGSLCTRRSVVKGTAPAEKSRRVARLHGKPAVLLFHVEGCEFCAKEIAASREYLKDSKGAKVLLVRGEEVTDEARDAFDLSYFPQLIELDRKGTVTRKYFSLVK